MDTRSEFEVFDVSILGADTHLWLSAYSTQGSVFGISRHLPTWPLASNTASPPQWLATAVREAREESGAEALVIGKALHDLIFDVPDIAALLQRARGSAGAAGNQLLVRILAAPQEISAWPWELIVDPQAQDRFLTMARDVHVIRAARSRTYPARQAPIATPLNLLMVLSNPLAAEELSNQAPFDLYEEKRSLLRELQPLVDRGVLAVHVEDRPTLDRLRSRMAGQRRGFHLLHYLGHAQPAGLQLEHRNGRARLVRSKEFALLLQQMPDLRLAVFAGCETARAPHDPTPDGKLSDQMSVADYCVRDACPMVIGMQTVLPFSTERVFTRFLYQALTGGQSVVEALRLARLAIFEDDITGGTLTNWAVPCLYVGGSLPGPVTDPAFQGAPVAPPRRVSLRLGVRQGELRFISRLSELRETIDMLSGTSGTRLLHVTGRAGTGKTALCDRALEELTPEIALLFVSARRLLESQDPVLRLASYYADIAQKCGREVSPQDQWSPMEWWERIIDDTTDLRVAVVLDDGDLLRGTEPGQKHLVTALQTLIGRRSNTRLAVVAEEEVLELNVVLSSNQTGRIHLKELGWEDVWQWIRRNLPMLTRYPTEELAGFYADLPGLEQWEMLAEAVSTCPTPTSDELATTARQLAARLRTRPAGRPVPPPFFGESAPTSSTPSTQTAPSLRVAIAGPIVDGREVDFGRHITQFAALHGVSGRMASGTSGNTGSLAELVPLPSPFRDTGTALVENIVHWLTDVIETEADIVVLDFGSDVRAPEIAASTQRLADTDCLAIAAGGNGGTPCYPAWEEAVLAVGALDENQWPRSYSPYFIREGKPDIYASDSIGTTPIASLLVNPEARGTSIAALHVAASATTVWSTNSLLTGEEVREILLSTAQTLHLPGSDTARRIDTDAALVEARRRLILETLFWGSMDLSRLLAEIGMRPETALPLIDGLLEEGRLVKVLQNGAERLEVEDPFGFDIPGVWGDPAIDNGAIVPDYLVDRFHDLARQRQYTAAKVRRLWKSGHEGRRLLALASLVVQPRAELLPFVESALLSSTSAAEVGQTLLAAERIIDHLADEDRRRFQTNLERVLGGQQDLRDSRLATAIRDLLKKLGS